MPEVRKQEKFPRVSLGSLHVIASLVSFQCHVYYEVDWKVRSCFASVYLCNLPMISLTSAADEEDMTVMLFEVNMIPPFYYF